MMKAHCDNCDTLVVNALPQRFVTVQPWGYQCVVGVAIRKEQDQVLCAACLRAAALEFAADLERAHPELRSTGNIAATPPPVGEP